MNTIFEYLTNHLHSVPSAVLLLDALLKSIVVLSLAGIVCGLWRQASAATRHLVWFLAVASLPLLPALNLIHVSWQKPVWTISDSVGTANQLSLAFGVVSKVAAKDAPGVLETARTSGVTSGGMVAKRTAAEFNVHWIFIGWLVWLAGTVVVLAKLAIVYFGRRKLAMFAAPVTDGHWKRLLAESCDALRLTGRVTLLQSEKQVMPMTWGWWRPVVLLPAEATQWADTRKRVVLLHELAHVKRRDYLTQIVAQMICALYWFNPLAWVAARKMCVEREGACDDLVLAGGCKASDYAGHLVEIAGSFRGAPQMAAIGMARSSQLEGRVAAIVDATRNRRLHSVAALMVLALIGGIAICIGGNGINTTDRSDESEALHQQQIARLKVFSVEKEKQSEVLAAATGETISPEFQEFFDAATNGDVQSVTNIFGNFMRSHPQYSHPDGYDDPSLRTSFWSPVLEIELAYEHIAACEPVYTKMAIDDFVGSIPAGSILFGGTDPGRGLPTAFSKSHVDADPFYTLTQNALADGTYLDYLRRTYGDQRQTLGQSAAACQADAQLQEIITNLSVALVRFKSFGTNAADPQWKEAHEAVVNLWEQRNDRVNAILADLQKTSNYDTADVLPKPLVIPTKADSERCFSDYTQGATMRAQNHQLKPGEDVAVTDGKTKVSGQVAVMQINGLMAKLIFDENPGHDFYVEESWPLDWMYPHLEPHGFIMKVNREPLASISDTAIQQDTDFWASRVTQMIGGWLMKDTSISDVVAFSEKVYLRHDLTGFTGDPRFVSDDYATRMYSKFRMAIARLYAWRAENATSDTEQQRMANAADFAFRQAVALNPSVAKSSAPNSAAAVYIEFLKKQHRDDDARQVQDMIEHFKSANGQASATSKTQMFQVRLALGMPTDNSQPMRIVGSAGQSAETLYVDKVVLLDEAAIQSAKENTSPQGYEEIEVTLTARAREQFAEITREHLHQRLAIVIDGKLWMAPVVQSEISGGKLEINGSFGKDEATALTAKINEVAVN